MDCRNIIIFYENHFDKYPAKTILSLTKLFKENNVKSYCFEEPSDESKEILIKNLEENNREFIHGTKVNVYEDPYVQAWIENSYIHLENKNRVFSPLEKSYILAMIRSYSKKMIDSNEVTLQLMRQTDEQDLHFCTMDMPRDMRNELDNLYNPLEQYNLRNNYMYEQILKQCNKFGDVLVLVGAAHFGIAKQLREQNIDVKEYYVSSLPTSDETDVLSLCLCGQNNQACDDYKLNVMMIDLYANPNLDPVQIIAKDLSYQIHDEL